MSWSGRAAECWPGAAQRLLLQATLGDGDPALAAWRAWQSVDSIATTDPASVFILPQLYLNLRRLSATEPALAKLRGVYRHTWVKNRLAIEGVRAATHALSDAGISTLLLKGIPLLQGVYRDLGARMMVDTDVAIRRPDLAAADRVLTRLGWRTSPAPVLIPFPPFLHAVVYTHPKWLDLDLHVEPLTIPCEESGIHNLWQRARTPPGAHAGVPEFTDLLLLTLCNGRKGDPQGRCRWIVDAMTLLRKAPIDWAQLPRRAAELQVRPTVLAQLQFLSQNMGAAVPESALRALQSVAPKSLELERDRVLCGIDPVERPLWALVPQRWKQYRFSCAAAQQPVSGWSFGRHCLNYLIWKYDLNGPWQVPALLYQSRAWRKD